MRIILMKRFILLLSLLTICIPINAEEYFSVYLVRHAEKQKNVDNPSLTKCGKIRAKQLAVLLELVPIEKIYSTTYQRTMQTAAPVSQSKNQSIKQYNPKYLPQLALEIKNQKQNSLIVGHSNTTPALIELLTETSVEKINEDNFQMLYQIQYINEQTLLTTIKQPLNCI